MLESHDVEQGQPQPSRHWATETTSLLRNNNRGRATKSKDSANSRAQDVWLIVKSSSPLVLSGFLQQSIGLVTIFQVGHLGENELGAVSLSIMTANITGYAVYQGMATALDTLCAQAFGSKKPLHVGLYFQQMLLFLWLLTIPIGIVWYSAGRILGSIVPEKDVADLAGTYMRVLLWGAPGYAAFEAGKKFLQAQGIFYASTYVLLLIAPLNMLTNWLFVWKLGFGFIGAPMAAALTNNLLPLFLFLFVVFIDGKTCWNGLTIKACQSWGVMIRLALPGFVMMEAEYLAFEILTISASHLSSTHLAAQSILSPLIALTFQAPLALAIVVSTTIARHIGAECVDRARSFAKTATLASFLIGILNFAFMTTLGASAAGFLTNEQDVIKQVAKVLPVVAIFQHFDSLATTFNGILRGLGNQAVGSFISMFCYYVIAMPVSLFLAFLMKWGLVGLWFGIAIALALHSLVVGLYLLSYSWDGAVRKAHARHAGVAA